MTLINNEIPRDSWMDFIYSNPYATPFQTPEYFDFYNSVPGFSSIALACENSGCLTALVVVTIQKGQGIKGFFSRRAIIYGGPLIHEGVNEALSLLLKTVREKIGGQAIYIETRNLHDYSEFRPDYEKNGWIYQSYVNFHLDCTSENRVWSNLSENRRRQIKKALKKGAEIISAPILSEVEEFYLILKELYKNKIHKPLASWIFFEQFFIRNMGKFFLVKFQNKIIGGIMCPLLEGHSIYEWYICGLDTEYKDVSPSVLATYAAIKYGFENGYERFDFMGAGKPGNDYGVREFKSKFGGVIVEHGRFTKILNPVLFHTGKIGLSALSKIKY